MSNRPQIRPFLPPRKVPSPASTPIPASGDSIAVSGWSFAKQAPLANRSAPWVCRTPLPISSASALAIHSAACNQQAPCYMQGMWDNFVASKSKISKKSWFPKCSRLIEVCVSQRLGIRIRRSVPCLKRE